MKDIPSAVATGGSSPAARTQKVVGQGSLSARMLEFQERSLPSLSIIIPTYNGLHHLRRCLSSVCRHAPANTQIIVVDDASSDGTAEWVRRTYPQVTLVVQPANGGFCRAVNAGLERAGGEVVELLNNDTEVLPNWCGPCLRQFADPTTGSVAPLVLYMARPNVIESAGLAYHICGWAYNRRLGNDVTPDDLVPAEVFAAPGSCGFFRRSALEQIGGLLPEYDAYFDDVDVGFRLRWAGYRCRYEPSSRVLHEGSASYQEMSERQVRLIARNEELIFWMNLPFSKLARGLLGHLAFTLFRLGRKARSGQLGPFLAGKWQALLLWRTILRQRRKVRLLGKPHGSVLNPALSVGLGVIGQGITWLKCRTCA